jgi:hypothetical protein
MRWIAFHWRWEKFVYPRIRNPHAKVSHCGKIAGTNNNRQQRKEGETKTLRQATQTAATK